MGENEEEKKLNVENLEKIQDNVPDKEEVKTQESKTQEEKNDDKNIVINESKVETEKKEASNLKKVETKKSKHVFLKAILVLIGLLVLVYFIFVMRNYLILNDIISKASEYRDIDNYSYYVKASLGEYTAMRKDNVIRIDQKGEEEQEIIRWINYDTNEEIISFQNSKVAVIKEPSDPFIALPFEFADTNEVMMGITLYTLIYTDEYNGKECYVLCLTSDYKKWIDKDTGLVIKTESGENSTTEISDIEIDNIKEIYKPDLTGFEIEDEKIEE